MCTAPYAWASANIKAAKAFVDKCKAGVADDDKLKIPSFPQPRKPRKVADTKYQALSEDNIATDCFGGSKGICVIAVVDAPAGDEFKENAKMVDLSKKYRNDPFSFVFVDANSQVGRLYKSNSVYPQLETARFQSLLSNASKRLVSTLETEM
jgi:hypothetical protein